jgi:hypothetical protein
MIFQQTSRYYSIETAVYETPDGEQVRYLRRRFLPSLDRFTLIQEHPVVERDRLDNITARYLGDPEQFWRVCDANPVMQPEQLEVVGRRVRITLPEGIPGTPNA